MRSSKRRNYEEQYEYFNDVICFDDLRDVHHFPGLWRGDPPMAPVNPGYSQKAHELKTSLVKRMQESRVTHLSKFIIRIDDLWNALLHEKFVFSFKNTLEMTAYTSLESRYNQWAWTFQSRMLEWQQAAENEIKTTEINEEKLKAVEAKLMTKLSTTIDDNHDVLKAKMLKFFEQSSKLQEMQAQWKNTFQIRLQNLAIELKANATNYCVKLVKSRQAFAHVDERKRQYREQLLTKAREVVATLKRGQLSEEELKKKFDEQWLKWIQGLPLVPKEKIDVEALVQTALTDYLKRNEGLILKKLREILKTSSLKKYGEHLELKVIPNVHVIINRKRDRSLWQHIKDYVRPTALNDSHIKQAQLTVDIVLKQAKEYLDNKQNDTFNPIHTRELVWKVEKAIDEHTAGYKEFLFTREFKIDVCLTACGYAVKQFEKMISNTWQRNDPLAYLEREMRKPLYSLFKNQYFQTAHEVAVAGTLCEHLAKPLEHQVLESLGRKVVDEMMGANSSFHTKSALKAKILLDLGRNVESTKEMHPFMVYLKSPRDSLKQWIKFYTEEFCDSVAQSGVQQSRLVSLAEDSLKGLVVLLRSKVKEVTKSFLQEQEHDSSVNTQEWLEKFREDEELKRKLAIDFDSASFPDHDPNGVQELNVANFTKEIQNQLSLLEHDLLNQFKTKDFTMETWKNRPYDMLFEQLRGCCEICPFCKEQCDCTMEGHTVKHSVQQHRPDCLGGYQWSHTNEMTLDLCSSTVGSDLKFKNKDTDGKYHPYKEYATLYPKWSIPVDMSFEASAYWKWFVGNYADQIAAHFGSSVPKDFPQEWRELKWKDAEKELKEKYRV